MLIHVNDAVSLQGARTLQHPFIIPYGVHQEYELQIVTGRDNHPVDVESRNCVKWTLTVTPSHETPTTVLAYAVFPENIATGSVIRFDLAATSVEMYKHVAGNPATPAVMQLLGFTEEDAPAALSLALPVALVTTAQQRLPVDLSTALMQEIQLATATVGAAQREISRLMADSDFAADSAAQSAAEAAASAENAQHSAQEAASSAGNAQQSATDAAASATAAGGSASAAAGSASSASGYSDDARLAAQAAEYARDGAVDAKVLAESAQSSAESAASTAAATTSAAIETQFRDDITATGDAATAAQTAAVAAQGSQQASAGSALSAQQSAQLAYEYARQAGQNTVLILDAPPTVNTASDVGRLAVWHDTVNDKNHIYHLVFISTSENATLYHWEECVLVSMGNVAGGYPVLDAGGKVASAQLPIAATNKLGAVMPGTQGITVTVGGILSISHATNASINAKASPFLPIVPKNIDYAVRSVLPNVTVIPSATSDYSLVDSSATTNNHSHVYSHSPSVVPTYRLPQVTDTTISHYIELTVDFTNVQTYSFLDHQGEAIVPLFTPSIAAGDVYTFKMEYSAIKGAWLIYPQKQGAVADDFVMRGEVGAANGVAGLDANGTVPNGQLPIATTSTVGVIKPYSVSFNVRPPDGQLMPLAPTTGQIDNRTQALSAFMILTLNKLNYAVTAAITDANHITLTDAQKATAQSVFGVGGDLTGTGAPTTSTVGKVMDRYLDTATGKTYTCTAVTVDDTDPNNVVTTYIWEEAVTESQRNIANGFAGLDANGKVASAQLPPFSNAPEPIIATTAPTTSTVGVVGQLYVDTVTSKTYHCTAITNTGTESEPAWSYTWTDDINAKGGTLQGALEYISGTWQVGLQQYAIVCGATPNNITTGSIISGYHPTGTQTYQIVCGQYNTSEAGAFIVGNGTTAQQTSNALLLKNNGNLYIAGGHQQGITVIPSATTAYTLKEGVQSHAPEAASVYILPAVTYATRTHACILDVQFSTNVLTYEFQDSSGTTLAPLPMSGYIVNGTIVRFLCTYSAQSSKWVIMPVVLNPEVA